MKIIKDRILDHYRTSILGLFCLGSGLWVLNGSLAESSKLTIGLLLLGGAMVLFGVKDPKNLIK